MKISYKQFEELHKMGMLKGYYNDNDFVKLDDKKLFQDLVTDIFDRIVMLMRLTETNSDYSPTITTDVTRMYFKFGNYSAVREIKR